MKNYRNLAIGTSLSLLATTAIASINNDDISIDLNNKTPEKSQESALYKKLASHTNLSPINNYADTSNINLKKLASLVPIEDSDGLLSGAGGSIAGTSDGSGVCYGCEDDTGDGIGCGTKCYGNCHSDCHTDSTTTCHTPGECYTPDCHIDCHTDSSGCHVDAATDPWCINQQASIEAKELQVEDSLCNLVRDEDGENMCIIGGAYYCPNYEVTLPYVTINSKRYVSNNSEDMTNQITDLSNYKREFFDYGCGTPTDYNCYDNQNVDTCGNAEISCDATFLSAQTDVCAVATDAASLTSAISSCTVSGDIIVIANSFTTASGFTLSDGIKLVGPGYFNSANDQCSTSSSSRPKITFNISTNHAIIAKGNNEIKYFDIDIPSSTITSDIGAIYGDYTGTKPIDVKDMKIDANGQACGFRIYGSILNIDGDIDINTPGDSGDPFVMRDSATVNVNSSASVTVITGGDISYGIFNEDSIFNLNGTVIITDTVTSSTGEQNAFENKTGAELNLGASSYLDITTTQNTIDAINNDSSTIDIADGAKIGLHVSYAGTDGCWTANTTHTKSTTTHINTLDSDTNFNSGCSATGCHTDGCYSDSCYCDSANLEAMPNVCAVATGEATLTSAISSCTTSGDIIVLTGDISATSGITLADGISLVGPGYFNDQNDKCSTDPSVRPNLDMSITTEEGITLLGNNTLSDFNLDFITSSNYWTACAALYNDGGNTTINNINIYANDTSIPTHNPVSVVASFGGVIDISGVVNLTKDGEAGKGIHADNGAIVNVSSGAELYISTSGEDSHGLFGRDNTTNFYDGSKTIITTNSVTGANGIYPSPPSTVNFTTGAQIGLYTAIDGTANDGCWTANADNTITTITNTLDSDANFTAGCCHTDSSCHVDCHTDTVPVGTPTCDAESSGYIEINNATDFNNIRNDLAGNYKLGANIDLSSIAEFDPIPYPVGDYFTGIIDGCNLGIYNLNINKPETYAAGLFSNLDGTVKNLDIFNATVYGGSTTNVGILAATSRDNLVVSNVNIYGGSVTGGSNTGSLIGIAYSGGSLIGSTSNADVICKANLTGYCGGLLGGTSMSGQRELGFTGTITSSTDSKAGGLIGWMSGGSLYESYSTADIDISYSGKYYGGLIARIYNSGRVYNSYATGDVHTTGGGGFVGYHEKGTIYTSYSLGETPYGNGFVEYTPYPDSLIDSFWDTETSGATTSGGNSEVGKTTAEMQTESTFTAAGWDFTDIWCIPATGGYPVLQWQDNGNACCHVDCHTDCHTDSSCHVDCHADSAACATAANPDYIATDEASLASALGAATSGQTILIGSDITTSLSMWLSNGVSLVGPGYYASHSECTSLTVPSITATTYGIVASYGDNTISDFDLYSNNTAIKIGSSGGSSTIKNMNIDIQSVVMTDAYGIENKGTVNIEGYLDINSVYNFNYAIYTELGAITNISNGAEVSLQTSGIGADAIYTLSGATVNINGQAEIIITATGASAQAIDHNVGTMNIYTGAQIGLYSSDYGTDGCWTAINDYTTTSDTNTLDGNANFSSGCP